VDKIIYGSDTETLHGRPMTLQFYSEDVPCERIEFVDAKSATKIFVKWVKSLRANCLHVVYVHHLAFDLPEFLWSRKSDLVSGAGEYDFHAHGLHFTGVYGAPTFCKITGSRNATVWLIDSLSFFRESLAQAAERVCPDLPKLTAPKKNGKRLGEVQFTKRDSGFVEYAMRDAVVAYRLGRAVEDFIAEYDIPQPVSVADMAAKIFRRKYMQPGDLIVQPNETIIRAALQSFHGGKNNITVPAGWYEDVSSIDISSAYPDAMAELPSFQYPKLYKKLASIKGRRVKAVPDLGVYCVSGELAPCKWPVVFSHAFKPLHGAIDRVWIQGYELNEALLSGELKPTKISGWYYDREHDHAHHAIREFVREHYKLKSAATSPTLRFMHKLTLNSLYGKFIQTRKSGSIAYTDVDSGETVTASELKAGGLFHPFIATAITAHTRARIHRLEHEYKALHTATDGIFTQARVSYAAKSSDKKPVKRAGLGDLTLEASEATLLLIRNKCYVLYGNGAKARPSLIFKGRKILKYAKHGFQGSVTDLERLIATNTRKYTVNKPNTLRDALKRGLTPNEFRERPYTLKVGPLQVHARRGGRKA
jgi:hypothetical protein